jgi:hypothetical protein
MGVTMDGGFLGLRVVEGREVHQACEKLGHEAWDGHQIRMARGLEARAGALEPGPVLCISQLRGQVAFAHFWRDEFSGESEVIKRQQGAYHAVGRANAGLIRSADEFNFDILALGGCWKSGGRSSEIALGAGGRTNGCGRRGVFWLFLGEGRFVLRDLRRRRRRGYGACMLRGFLAGHALLGALRFCHRMGGVRLRMFGPSLGDQCDRAESESQESKRELAVFFGCHR